MSIDVASLVFEIDSTQAVTARERLEGLEAAGAKVDASARRVKTATEMAGIGLEKTAAGSRSAARAATEHAQAQGVVERSTLQAERAAVRAAERETAAWGRVEAALEKRNAAYRGSQALVAMKAEAAAAGALEARIDRLLNSIDPTRAAQARLNAEMAEATSLFKAGAIGASDYAKATAILDQRMDAAARGHGTLIGLQGKATGSSKALTQAGLNLSRQFADIGVTAAMGMSPLMILIQQGPQIADVFAQAKTQGMGFGDVMKGLGGGVGRFLPAILAVGTAVGLAVGAFALFEREIDKSTKYATTWGDTWNATVHVVGEMIVNGPIGDGLRWLGKAFGATLDAIVDGVMWWADKTVGHFGAAYQLIVQNWRRLPEVFGVIVQGAANLTINAVEGMINKVIDGVNYMLTAAGKSALDHVNLPEIRVANAKLTAEYERMAKSIEGNFRAGREGIADRIAKQADKEFLARQKATKATDDHSRALKDNSKAVDANAEAMAKAAERSVAYADSLAKQVFEFGKSALWLLEWNSMMEAAAAPTKEAADLINEYTDQLVGLMKGKEAVDDLNKAIGEFVATPNPAFTTGAEGLAAAFEEAARQAADIRYAIDDVFYGIKDKNWAAAFAGLFNVIKQLQAAFDVTATKSQRMGAVGGVLTGVGGAVGGRAGSAISAVGSGFSAAGAAAGMAGSFGAIGGAIAGLAGPIGIAVAGFSLLSGILGDQKAKKRAKLEQEARDMESARAAALEEANRQAELQLRILELSGDEIGALTKRREAELATLKGASRALAEYVHALEDWVKAVDLAKDAVSKAQDDLRAAYEADKDRLNAIIAGVETARARLRDAYQRERGAIEGTISSVRSLVETFADFRKELDMMAVANDPSRQYGYTRRQFASATNDNFVERGRAFAEASQSASATELDFQRDLAAVRRRTDEAARTAQTQLTAAEKQLLALDNLMSPLLGANDNLMSVDEAIRGILTAEQEAALATEELARLDAQVGALITINSSVLTVAQAVNNLQGALGALAAAQAAKPAEGGAGAGSQAVGLTGYVDKNADLAALYASGGGMASGRSKEEFAAYHWERYGQAEGRAYRPFARGGAFTNGIVSEPTPFNMGVMGEQGPEAIMPLEMGPNGLGVRSRGGDTGRLEALVEDLTREVGELRKAADRAAENTKNMDQRGKRQEFNGAYVRGQSPDDPVVVVAA